MNDLFDDTGLSDVSITTREGIVKFPSIEQWVHMDIKGWTLADALDDDQFELLLREADIALQEFVLKDGTVAFQSPAHIVCATKKQVKQHH